MAVSNFRLKDETGRGRDLTGKIEHHADGIYVTFDDDRDVAARVAVQLFDGKVQILVFSDASSEEPTHQIVPDIPVSPKEWRPRR